MKDKNFNEILPGKSPALFPLYKDIPSGEILKDFALITQKNTPDKTVTVEDDDDMEITSYNRGAYTLVLDEGFKLEKLNEFTRDVKNFLLIKYLDSGHKEKIRVNIGEFFDLKDVKFSRTQKKNFVDSLKVLRHCGFDTYYSSSSSFKAAGSSFIVDYEVYNDNDVDIQFGSKFKKYVLDRAPIAKFPLRMFQLDPSNDRRSRQICEYLYPLAAVRYEGNEEEKAKAKADSNDPPQVDYVAITTLLEHTDLPTRSEIGPSSARQAERIIEPLFKALDKLDEEGREIMSYELLYKDTKKPLRDEDYYSIVKTEIPPEVIDSLNEANIDISTIYPGREKYPNTSLFFDCFIRYTFYEFDKSGAKTRQQKKARRAAQLKKNIAKANKKKAAKK